MMILETTHPELYALLNSREFAVQQSSDSKFAQVAVDMAIKQIVNRDTKMLGGILGFSLKAGTVEWLMPANSIHECMITACSWAVRNHHLRPQQSKKDRECDEATVVKMLETIDEMVNPFLSSCELRSLSPVFAHLTMSNNNH